MWENFISGMTRAPLLMFLSDSLASEDNRASIWLMAAVLGLVAIAYVVGWVLKRQPEGTINPAILRTFNHRVRAWWMIFAILALGIVLGRIATVVLFGMVSFWALREFVTMTPTRRGDHRALFWTFFLFTPLQYLLVGIGRTYADTKGAWFGLSGLDFFGLYSVMIPVYASLVIPARIALSGDHKRFLERSAKIQLGLLLCVYALSHAPALLDLQLYSWRKLDGGEYGWVLWSVSPERNAGLLFYFILIVQLNDGLQFLWGKLLGRHVIAPKINASKTWEGYIGGILSTALIGMLLWKVTPFTIWGAACMSLVIAVMGFAGSMTMSAIKRDRGVRDYGTLVQGHAGVLDRIDSVCFAAPIFFHLTRLFLYVLPMSSGGIAG